MKVRNMLKTITEQIYAPIGLREENGQKYVEGVATIADAVNQNGRIYPRAI